MNTLVEPRKVRLDADNLWLELSDGRTPGVPLAWFPRLLEATETQPGQARPSKRGLH